MIREFLARVRSLWRNLFRSGDVHAEMAEEFRHHLASRTDDLIREGLPPERAARQARLEFGHIESHKQDARASRGLRLFDEIGFYWLDAKLGLRMLKKYPGLSLVSVVGMAVAIAIAAGGFGFIQSMLDPTLPLDEGERVVSIQNEDLQEAGNPDRQSLHDFTIWRDELEAIEDLAAYTTARRNLIIPDGTVEFVSVAEMSAAGFRVARTAPVLGRTLIDEDERETAAAVVVIAHEEWQRLFSGDSNVVGRQVQLGTGVYTIVGVMPEGFRFPLNNRFWVPLRLDPADYEVGGGPAIFMFGRLRDGATLDDARTEIRALGRRMAAAYPDTHEHLRAQVLPYTHPYFDVDNPAMVFALRGAQIAISLLLVVVAVNVGTLVYARTATRAGEIATRTALGASRRRVVGQLFVEAFILSAAATVIGLAVATVGLSKTADYLTWAIGDELPFWWSLGLSSSLVLYVMALAVVGGVIVGVLPGLKATGEHVQAGLQQFSSRGSQLQLGRTWTALIVAQVALAVAVLPFAVRFSGQALRRATMQPGYPAEQFLRSALSIERVEIPPADQAAAYERDLRARFQTSVRELVERLQAAPEVIGVAFGNDFPEGGSYSRIEVAAAEGAVTTGASQTVAQINRSNVELLSVFGVPVLAGRQFTDRDARDGGNAVIVNYAFAQEVLDDTNVLGTRIRIVRNRGDAPADGSETDPWLEVVGVIPEFTVPYSFDPTEPELYRPEPRLYQPLDLSEAPTTLALSVHVRGNAVSFVERLRETAAAVDPHLLLYDLRTAEDFRREGQYALLGGAAAVVAVTTSVFLLSAAGIYAMMSFTVARRRREIGIRSALGADPRRLLTGIFARAGAQLGVGVLCGLVLAAAVEWAGGGPPTGRSALLISTVALFMFGIGVLATLGPARRGLAIQPTEALRED